MFFFDKGEYSRTRAACPSAQKQKKAQLKDISPSFQLSAQSRITSIQKIYVRALFRSPLLALQKIGNLQALLHHIAPDIHRLLDPLYRSGIRLHGNSLRNAGLYHIAS